MNAQRLANGLIILSIVSVMSWQFLFLVRPLGSFLNNETTIGTVLYYGGNCPLVLSYGYIRPADPCDTIQFQDADKEIRTFSNGDDTKTIGQQVEVTYNKDYPYFARESDIWSFSSDLFCLIGELMIIGIAFYFVSKRKSQKKDK